MVALSIRKLVKVYRSQVTALKGISFDVTQGDFFALLGQNGAGKSTTIGIISSLVKKTSGSVTILNYDLDRDIVQAKAQLGIVPQEINFSPFEKVHQILEYQAGYYGITPRIAAPRIEYYLKETGLWHKRDQQAISLSGGLKRRLLIARALVNQPRLLILDEPTAGVDVELRHMLWHFLTELNKKGTTIILTTHYLEEAEKLCKNVAIIDHGEIIVNTNMKSLINQLHIQTCVLDCIDPLPETLQLPTFITRIIDKQTLEVEIPKDASINQLFEALQQNRITVSSMRNKSSRLEELFIHLINVNKRIHRARS